MIKTEDLLKKFTPLSDEEQEKFQEHIDKNMEAFRYDLRRKQIQSGEDTRRIILNA